MTVLLPSSVAQRVGGGPMLPDCADQEAARSTSAGGVRGIGIDLEEISAVERANAMGGPRRRERLFTARELAHIGDNIGRQASRFAAKEAVAKALGAGFREGLAARHIEILSASDGAPTVTLHGPALSHAQSRQVEQCFVSWAHTGTHVVAMAIAAGATSTPDRSVELEESP